MAARALYNPHHQGLSSLADAPAGAARLNPLRPAACPEADRDEAGAKCLMRRVLHFASGLAAALRDDGSAFDINVRWQIQSLLEECSKMTVQWRWLIWQVFVPIIGPIIISVVVILLEMSLNPNFTPDINIIVDVSPWALTFYTLTLIGSSLHGLRAQISSNLPLAVWLAIVAFAVGLYAARIVVERHDSTFVPGPPVYFVTLCLLIVAVILCHNAQTVIENVRNSI